MHKKRAWLIALILFVMLSSNAIAATQDYIPDSFENYLHEAYTALPDYVKDKDIIFAVYFEFIVWLVIFVLLVYLLSFAVKNIYLAGLIAFVLALLTSTAIIRFLSSAFLSYNLAISILAGIVPILIGLYSRHKIKTEKKLAKNMIMLVLGFLAVIGGSYITAKGMFGPPPNENIALIGIMVLLGGIISITQGIMFILIEILTEWIELRRTAAESAKESRTWEGVNNPIKDNQPYYDEYGSIKSLNLQNELHKIKESMDSKTAKLNYSVKSIQKSSEDMSAINLKAESDLGESLQCIDDMLVICDNIFTKVKETTILGFKDGVRPADCTEEVKGLVTLKERFNALLNQIFSRIEGMQKYIENTEKSLLAIELNIVDTTNNISEYGKQVSLLKSNLKDLHINEQSTMQTNFDIIEQSLSKIIQNMKKISFIEMKLDKDFKSEMEKASSFILKESRDSMKKLESEINDGVSYLKKSLSGIENQSEERKNESLQKIESLTQALGNSRSVFRSTIHQLRESKVIIDHLGKEMIYWNNILQEFESLVVGVENKLGEFGKDYENKTANKKENLGKILKVLNNEIKFWKSEHEIIFQITKLSRKKDKALIQKRINLLKTPKRGKLCPSPLQSIENIALEMNQSNILDDQTTGVLKEKLKQLGNIEKDILKAVSLELRPSANVLGKGDKEWDVFNKITSELLIKHEDAISSSKELKKILLN